MDMVHHNPGEPPFQTAFSDPKHLVRYGYNTQVFKHINCVATYDALGHELFIEGSDEHTWLTAFTKEREKEIARAKAEGLMVFYHVDLFVLPKRLIEIEDEDILDNDGRITFDKPRTQEIHRVLFDELFERFDIDGLIIRVGETYLYDTPFHEGNGPINHEANDRADSIEESTKKEQATFISLLSFLREEVCVKHGKYIVFRTWDTSPSKFHANPDYYLAVTDEIEPHENLFFSIKHVAGDFWRRIPFNECLTKGKHPQVVEVQSQREYEGKGAYPNYVMEGVINGAKDMKHPKGIKDIIGHPLIRGIYGWSRGGGWYGPYIKDELFCDLHAYVIANYFKTPKKGEEAIFFEYARDIMSLDEENALRFRSICLLSAEAVLKGKYCEVHTTSLPEMVWPNVLWMRDDRLGGLKQLSDVFTFLYTKQLFAEAQQEKDASVALWQEIENITEELSVPNPITDAFITTAVEYGKALFTIIAEGWNVMSLGYKGDKYGSYERDELVNAVTRYDAAWETYRALTSSPYVSTLYKGVYWSWPGEDAAPGMDASVMKYRNAVAMA